MLSKTGDAVKNDFMEPSGVRTIRRAFRNTGDVPSPAGTAMARVNEAFADSDRAEGLMASDVNTALGLSLSSSGYEFTDHENMVGGDVNGIQAFNAVPCFDNEGTTYVASMEAKSPDGAIRTKEGIVADSRQQAEEALGILNDTNAKETDMPKYAMGNERRELGDTGKSFFTVTRVKKR